jgi:hypothetical protein
LARYEAKRSKPIKITGPNSFMTHERQTDYRITAVSAAQFFAQRAQQASVQSGVVQRIITVPERGCIHLPSDSLHNSLLLVDGLYGDSCAIEEYISALKQGALPSAPRTPPSHDVSRRCIHTSSDLLSRRERTILEACGLIEELTSSALASSRVSCSQCGQALTRFSKAEQLLAAITSTHKNSRVRVFAESSAPALADWASATGFTVSTSPNGAPQVLLDSIECWPEATVPLGRSVRSLWTIPDIVFVVHSERGVMWYGPSGWCDRCRRTEGKPSRDGVRSLLERGIAVATDQAREASLLASATHTVEELLSLAISELSLRAGEPLCIVKTALTKLGLSHLSLGTLTSSLSARDISALSVAISSILARESGALIILDLPAGVFAHERSSEVQAYLTELSLEHAIVCSADLFSAQSGSSAVARSLSTSTPPCGVVTVTPHRSSGLLSFELRPGSVIALENSHVASPFLYQEIVTSLTSGASSDRSGAVIFETSSVEHTIHPVPVFASSGRSLTLLLNEIGLGERLAQLYAASLDARALGLSAKDISLATTRKNSALCSECRGLGVQLFDQYISTPRPRCSPCPGCHGDRFVPPIGGILFRGIQYSVMLNQPIELSAPILSTLAKARETIELMLELGLGHLPLGMPLCLLSQSETRILRVLQALRAATPQKPAIIVLEEPEIGFRRPALATLERVRSTHEKSKNCVWIEVRAGANAERRN